MPLPRLNKCSLLLSMMSFIPWIVLLNVPESSFGPTVILCLSFSSILIGASVNDQIKWNNLRKYLKTIIEEKTSLNLKFANQIVPSGENPDYVYCYFKIEGLDSKVMLKMKTDNLKIEGNQLSWVEMVDKIKSKELEFDV